MAAQSPFRGPQFSGHSFVIFEILQKFFFPLLAMTFLLLIERNKVDAATMELLGTQMICTTSAGPCILDRKTKPQSGTNSLNDLCGPGGKHRWNSGTLLRILCPKCGGDNLLDC